MRRILLSISLSLLVLDAIACSSGTTPPDAPSDAGLDARVTDAGHHADAEPDGTVVDGGRDATSPDATPDASPDSRSDAHPESDASPDAPVPDSGPNCAAIVAKMMSASVSPPSDWVGLDLSNGSTVDAGVGGGGLTIDQSGILACATSVESTSLDGGAPSQPGSRTASFGGAAGGVTVSFNVESRVISWVTTTSPATTTLTFHSRAGGAYGNADGGTNVYVVGLGAGTDAGAAVGYVTKNGQDFPTDWSPNAGSAARGWVNEMYDGIMATFAPSAPAADDCLKAPAKRLNGLEVGPSCLVANSEAGATFGVRPLGFYMTFAQGTNHTQSMYEAFKGGAPSCATPHAAMEVVDYWPIDVGQNLHASIGPVWNGVFLGAIAPAEAISNGGGLLASEANTIAGCSGVSVTARDPGYSAEAWGPNGEIELEYNADSGVAYKLFAKQGYKGALHIVSSTEDGGTTEYVIAPGTLTSNGAPLTLDWAGSAASLNAQITDISNAFQGDYCDAVDADCVAAGSCEIQPDDGHGHSTFTLSSSPDVIANCGDHHPLTFVFPQGKSVPSEIYATNPGGK